MADDLHPASPLDALNARGLTAKREYVHGLEQRHDPEALSLLTECLCDESSFLRDLAEQAFLRLGEEHAGALVPLLAGGLWYTRLSAARLLGRIGYRPAVPALLELCGDRTETVALEARNAVVAVARQRAAGRVAHALHRLSAERRAQRLAEVAERDGALAKTLERMLADVDLMAADHPDQLVDPERPAAATRSPASPSPPPASASAPSPAAQPPGAAARGAPKPRPPRAPAAPTAPSSAAAPPPATAPPPPTAPPPTAAPAAPPPPASTTPPAAPKPGEAPPAS